LLDDPDDLQSRALVSRRIHGTAMASLILHAIETKVVSHFSDQFMFVP